MRTRARTIRFGWLVTFVLLFSNEWAYAGDSCGSYCGPRWNATAELLFLQPRNAEVVYGTPMDGPLAPPAVPIQIGRLGMVDSDYEPGFRVGFGRMLGGGSSLGVGYTHFESTSADQLDAAAIGPTTVIRSMVLHPSSANAATDFSAASATLDIGFDLLDLDYRQDFLCGPQYRANYLLGLRYARLEQDFAADFVNGGTESVLTDVSFDGGGIRFGVEAERHACNSGWMLYGRAVTSFLAGEFRGDYFQGGTFDPVVVDTHWKAGRVVTVLDAELGMGWTCSSGRLRLSAGYVFSTWLNTVTSDDLIGAVQTNNFLGLADGGSFGSGLTFDGFAFRAELLW